MTVLAAHGWPTNADLIADVARLGYLRTDARTLDPTYGKGGWWRKWRPAELVTHDKYELDGVDFRALPHDDQTFDAVAFDPPFKLNGTPTVAVDGRYGVHVVATRDERLHLMLDGVTECTRVLRPGGVLLVKCQDQVNGGKVRWQTDLVTERARELGLTKVDAFLMLGGRSQPKGRRQEHARRNYSTLFVFRLGRKGAGHDMTART